jgi:hypothetical protein
VTSAPACLQIRTERCNATAPDNSNPQNVQLITNDISLQPKNEASATSPETTSTSTATSAAAVTQEIKIHIDLDLTTRAKIMKSKIFSDLMPHITKELQQQQKNESFPPSKKKRLVKRRPGTIRTIMSKFPTQKFYRNEYTDLDVDIISCTSPSNFYVHLKTRLRDVERLQERVERLCIGIS